MNNDYNIMMQAKKEQDKMQNVQVLAISYVPMQWANWNNIYDDQRALEYGTAFPELNLPLVSERGAK